jgi:hypothetical protein
MTHQPGHDLGVLVAAVVVEDHMDHLAADAAGSTWGLRHRRVRVPRRAAITTERTAGGESGEASVSRSSKWRFQWIVPASAF